MSQNSKYGFIDKKGKVVIPCQYDDVRGFENGMAKVSLNGEIIFGEPFCIDKTGKRID
ncbi:WG repeat-containing protein [Moraxella bovoculi]|uniref:WG repeat-containing protein n=1 Tax=Moraxella bovoculi TaxID=386891 RepID=UPI003F4FA6F8